jgi:predicted nucleic-acid-binding protein
MIALDTNVLIRYLTSDDPAQAAKAAKVIDHAAPASLFLSAIVLCEMVWVLESGYGYTHSDIALTLAQILRTAQFEFENKELLWAATNDYETGKGDFSDHLIARAAESRGCQHTFTFDRALRNNRLFRLL